MDTVTLVEKTFSDSYLGAERLPEIRTDNPNIEIAKAYLCNNPAQPYFGKILAILEYQDEYYMLYFHIWRERQSPTEANRMTNLYRLVSNQKLNILEREETSFGLKAFWLHTPDSELDPDSLALRSVAKALKQYSVNNRLCAKFKKWNKKGVCEPTCT